MRRSLPNARKVILIPRLGRMLTKPTLNPDGVSVKGCSIIYAPKGQAGEYAPLATNPYRGCGHQCLYCYVPHVTKQNRREFDAGAMPRRDFLPALRKDAGKYQAAGIREQVMLFLIKLLAKLGAMTRALVNIE
jgi:hypothetical protein